MMSARFPLRCWAEIDLRAFAANVAAISRELPAGTCYISVVKADGYGLGIGKLVDILITAGVGMLAVANVAEGAAVRALAPKTPILLLSANLPEEDDFLFEYGLTPTVSSVAEVQRFQGAAERHRKTLPVHLKFDTGMGRLGIWYADAGALFDAAAHAPGIRVRGIYSHLASGEDADFTRLQSDRLLKVLRGLDLVGQNLLVHIGNSSGLANLPPRSPFNAVRIGLLQFGIQPPASASAAPCQMAPVVGLHSRISLVKSLPKGTGISYGRTHVLERDSRVAVLSAGYADGISRACSNRASVLVRGRRCPILGSVTMDEVIIDVTDLPEAACGDRATFFGQQDEATISIHEYSASCGTIPWESLCAISQRAARIYV